HKQRNTVSSRQLLWIWKGMPMSSESPPGRTAKLSVYRKVRQLKTLFSAFSHREFGVRRQSAVATVLWICSYGYPEVQSAVATALCRRTPKIGLQLLTRSANIGVRFWRLVLCRLGFRDSVAEEPTFSRFTLIIQ